MSFIEMDGKKAINLQHVKTVYRDRNNNNVLVTYVDGTDERFTGYSIVAFGPDKLDEINAPVVAATPGFELLRFWFDNDKEQPTVEAVLEELDEQADCRGPIIAWHLCWDGPRPITLKVGDSPSKHSERGEGREAILCPDGRVVEPLRGCWKDVKAWAAEVCESWTEWREKKQKTDAAGHLAASTITITEATNHEGNE